MDGLRESLDDPIGWAAETIFAGFVEMGESCEISEVESIYYENKHFLEAAFEEEDIPMPSDAEIIKAAKEYLKQHFEGL